VVIVLLATGMLFAIRGVDALAAAQRARIRAGESQISLAEELRFSGEAMISSARGYLLTGDRALLEQLVRMNASFDHSLSMLRKLVPESRARRVAQDLARVGDELVRVQRELIAARAGSPAPELLMRFRAELLPMQAALGDSLDRFVQQRQQHLEALYEQSARERHYLMLRIYVLFALLAPVACLLTWLFARRRMYALETQAHEAARSAIAARDELMGIVAHDLRNPLTSIALKAALVQRLSEAPELRESAESIAGSVRQMERLIGGMLDVSVIESGRFAVRAQPCAVGALMRSCLNTFSPLFAARGVQLEISANHRLMVQADAERIAQLMSNLLGNALKYAPPRSTVRVTAQEYGGVARFAVADAGPGILPEHLPHVFDRYWKGEAAGKAGTGLGLFIAKGIVDAHGGDIGVHSAPGAGATFYFTLPIASSRIESARADVAERESPSTCVAGLGGEATLQTP
jgi:signal transduction histidine kinase